MKVFLGEYVCGGGFGSTPADEIDESLRLEGAAMLASMAEDLAMVASLSIPIAPDLCPELPDCERHVMDPRRPLWAQWAKAARGCDAAVIIAPEKDGLLAKAVGMLRAADVNVIAGSGDFLRVASDKLQTARVFCAGGVPHPPSLLPNDPRSAAKLQQCSRFVVKPRDGCGTESISLFDDLADAINAATENDLVQAFIPGTPASAAAIVNGNEMVVLPAVSQDISLDPCCYRGGAGPLCDDLQRRAAALVQCALGAMPPGLRGFIGLDLILGDDSGGDVVVEVNPRLTTSYVGLRHIVDGNLAARLLGLQQGPVRCRTAVDSVRWTRDGRVCVGEAVSQDA